jgi:hypothetical protein
MLKLRLTLFYWLVSPGQGAVRGMHVHGVVRDCHERRIQHACPTTEHNTILIIFPAKFSRSIENKRSRKDLENENITQYYTNNIPGKVP